jgi:triacylglycerol lipase
MLPVVLHHGLFGFGDIEVAKVRLSYFHKIDRAIAGRGHPLIVSRVHPTGSIERRARELKATILTQLRALGCDVRRQRVMIVAHSMGGLDARYMISRLGMDDRVAALITVCTPHRGSPYADWAIENVGRKLGGLAIMRKLGIDVRAINDLTLESCARFNESIDDAPAVRYFSISAARPWHRIPAFLLHSYRMIHEREGDNDGLVSVTSAHWGQHLETWPADHLHAINRRWVVEIRRPTGNIAPYYVKMLEEIGEEGTKALRHGGTEG